MPVRSQNSGTPVPVGEEFVVNTTTLFDQFDPMIAPLTGGGYVVLWSSGSSSSIELRAQRLDADGNKLGGEILIDSATSGGINSRDYRVEATGRRRLRGDLAGQFAR